MLLLTTQPTPRLPHNLSPTLHHRFNAGLIPVLYCSRTSENNVLDPPTCIPSKLLTSHPPTNAKTRLSALSCLVTLDIAYTALNIILFFLHQSSKNITKGFVRGGKDIVTSPLITSASPPHDHHHATNVKSLSHLPSSRTHSPPSLPPSEMKTRKRMRNMGEE